MGGSSQFEHFPKFHSCNRSSESRSDVHRVRMSVSPRRRWKNTVLDSSPFLNALRLKLNGNHFDGYLNRPSGPTEVNPTNRRAVLTSFRVYWYAFYVFCGQKSFCRRRTCCHCNDKTRAVLCVPRTNNGIEWRRYITYISTIICSIKI